MSRLSYRVENLGSSPIREILSVIDKPGMISFAGGLPALDSMPCLSIDNMPMSKLQYGESTGDLELREFISAEKTEEGFYCSADQVIILSGSQQGIDLAAKLFVDAGSAVGVETPTYLAALQVFRFFGAEFKSFRHFTTGLMLSDLDLRMIYVIPTFQNPAGYCYSEQERKSLAEYCDSTGTPLFEDDPYRELVYERSCRIPVCSLLKKGSWIYQGSFSKTFTPGMRLGFMICSRDLIQPLSRLKQAADLHSSRISQWLALGLLQDRARRQRMRSIRSFYRDRRDSFQRSLTEHFAELATWDTPPGGLFFWLRLNQRIDLDLLLKQAIDQNVAFMPGDHFIAEGSRSESYLRLNFSHADEAQAAAGLSILAQLVRSAK